MNKAARALSSAVFIALTAVGCSSTEQQTAAVLDESLPGKSSSWKNITSYPGNVTCGEYLDRDFQGLPTYKPFVVVDTEANLRPNQLDIAVYCSDDPESALNSQLKINYAEQRAEIDAILDDFRALAEPLLAYEKDNRYFPWTEQGLAALATPSPYGNPPINFPEGGYISEVPVDPWGQAYDYECPPFAGIRVLYKIQSLGADGKEGGSGPDADIKHSYVPYFDHLARI